MTRRFYKRGDRIDGMSVAGEDCWIYEHDGLTANIFMAERGAMVPLISSDSPGSGKLDAFLELLKTEFGSTLLFVSVMNPGLGRHLDALGIKWETCEQSERYILEHR
jgi:hypothetical protein